MSDAVALKVAIDLVQVPSRARYIRSRSLPDGVVVLLRIAAGDEAARAEATHMSGRPRELVIEAAAFFIEQILLFPGADSYRVLGARQNATAGELRRNMALLLRWFHPDLDPQGERSIFAGRVTKAWEDLKTPERRAAYDTQRALQKKKKSRHRFDGPLKRAMDRTKPWVTRSGSKRDFVFKAERVGLWRRTLVVLFGLSR